MDNQKRYYSQDKSTFHKVYVFDLSKSSQYWHISCNVCKFSDQCVNIRHKREICEVADKTGKMLLDFTYGHVNGFINDEFYILSQKSNRNKLNKIIKLLTKKFIEIPNVKN